MKRLLVIALLLGASTGWAGPIDDAAAANAAGDYATEFGVLQPLAIAGDAFAQSRVGVMYDRGQGVPQDNAEAIKWFRLAAAQGDRTAQYNLALMYGKGRGVARDYVRAHMWFNLGAMSGNARAVEAREMAAIAMTPEQLAVKHRSWHGNVMSETSRDVTKN